MIGLVGHLAGLWTNIKGKIQRQDKVTTNIVNWRLTSLLEEIKLSFNYACPNSWTIYNSRDTKFHASKSYGFLKHYLDLLMFEKYIYSYFPFLIVLIYRVWLFMLDLFILCITLSKIKRVYNCLTFL